MDTFKSLLPGLDIKEQRFLWLIRLRFISLFVQFPLSLIGRTYGYLDQKNHIIFSVLFTLFLIYNVILHRKFKERTLTNISSGTLNFQISLDLLLFTTLLLLSGGINNPLYPVFYVIAVIGGIFTVGKGKTFFILLVACISIVQLYPAFIARYAWDMIFNLQTIPYFVTQILIPAGTYFISHSFGELLVKSQKSLIHIAVQNERLDRLRALGALSSGFSHEFASPLHAAKIRLQRIERKQPAPDEDVVECLDALKECEVVLKKMNSSQLNMVDTDLEVIDLENMVIEASKTWKHDYPNIQLVFQTVPAEVRANRINLTQAFLNILDNAAESMDDGGVISLFIEKLDHEVVLTIKDQGTGFAEDVLARLGEPFNTNKEDGTGLGLYSTLLFMHAVSGELSVFNNKEQGATVILSFPQVSAE